MLRPVITGMFGIGRQYDPAAGSMVYDIRTGVPRGLACCEVPWPRP